MAWKCGLDSPGDQCLRGKAMADQAASGKGFTGTRGGLRREEEPAGGRGSETGLSGRAEWQVRAIQRGSSSPAGSHLPLPGLPRTKPGAP